MDSLRHELKADQLLPKSPSCRRNDTSWAVGRVFPYAITRLWVPRSGIIMNNQGLMILVVNLYVQWVLLSPRWRPNYQVNHFNRWRPDSETKNPDSETKNPGSETSA